MIAVIAVLAALTGCAPQPAELPDGIAISVYQNRFDYSPRKLEIQVSNGSGGPFTVTGASFDSTRFTEPAVWAAHERTLAPGTALDLRVQLPEPVCGDVPAEDTVTLDFALPDGRAGSVTVVPSDEEGWIDRINAQDCLAATVDGIAAITAPDRLEWTPGATAPGVLEFSVEPTGAGGEVTLLQARGTVLLRLAAADGGVADALPLDLVLDAGAPPTTIRIAFAPNRCDAHAVAEDKRGTFFPIDVRTEDGVEGIYYTAVSDAVRGEIYAYYGDYCGLPGG